MPDKIEELAHTLLKNPTTVKIAVSKPAEKIKQTAYVCYDTQKLDIIKHLFSQGDLKRVIIFSGKKQKVKQIQHALLRMRINSGEMHSDLDQAQRDEMMYRFKSGQIDVLVATDIVARGIDIDDIAMVINFDVPQDAEDYVHRIGRTARADRDGRAITFISPDDIRYFKEIERFLEKTVEKVELPEGLGDAQEYKTSGPSAKKTRRNDRDRNAHRRKPRQNNDRKRNSQEEKVDRREANRSEKRDNTRTKGNNYTKGNNRKSKSKKFKEKHNNQYVKAQQKQQEEHNNKQKSVTGIRKLLQKPLKWLRSKL